MGFCFWDKIILGLGFLLSGVSDVIESFGFVYFCLYFLGSFVPYMIFNLFYLFIKY